MKKLFAMMGVSVLMFSCGTPEPVVVEAAPLSYMVDDYYILMSDAYHLRPGMTYAEVKEVLKQNPFEIHQNIEDYSTHIHKSVFCELINLLIEHLGMRNLPSF